MAHTGAKTAGFLCSFGNHLSFPMGTSEFYDALAPYYHLIYADWEVRGVYPIYSLKGLSDAKYMAHWLGDRASRELTLNAAGYTEQNLSKQTSRMQNDMTESHDIRAGTNGKKRFLTGLVLATSVVLWCQAAAAAQAPVNLGTAGNFVILAKSGISTGPASAITGDIGVSPINSTAITGFALMLTANSPFATSAQVTGDVYAPDYAAPTPANLTTAIGDMGTAYTDAAGRTSPDFTELGAGQIGGLTLVPGLYKWSTDVLISSDVTLNGGPNDVWIFQIARKITQANGTKVFLSGGARAANVFWQAFGDVTLGTTSHFEGIIIAQTSISLGTGASINGRLLAQTAVTLEGDAVVAPTAAGGSTLVSAAVVTAPYADTIGQSVDLGTKTFTAPWSGNAQFYRIRSGTVLTIKSITLSGGNVAITYN